jgi:hypothetical protein
MMLLLFIGLCLLFALLSISLFCPIATTLNQVERILQEVVRNLQKESCIFGSLEEFFEKGLKELSERSK